MFKNYASECLPVDVTGSTKKPLSRNKSSYCVNYPFVYFFGGRQNNICLKDFWRFNLETKLWQELFIEHMPLLESHATCLFNDKLYIFGGKFGVPQSTFLYWREGNKRFKLVKHFGSSPPNYRGHTFVAHGICMYIFGGWCEFFGANNKIWKYDTEFKTWTHLKPIGDCPSHRYNHSCAVFGDNMWIYGGTNRTFKCCSDFWRYNFNSNSWSSIKLNPSPPPPLCFHSSIVTDNFLLICGGKTFEDRPNFDIWVYSFQNLTWKSIGTVEQHFGCKLNVFSALSVKVDAYRSQLDAEIDQYPNFIRSINGNQAQKSADSGYIESRIYSSQDSLLSKQSQKMPLSKHSATNLGFINDDFNIPGYVDEVNFLHKKSASTLAIPVTEHRVSNGKNHDIEMTAFIPYSTKVAIKVPPKSTLINENVNKILFIGHLVDSKNDLSLYTLSFK